MSDTARLMEAARLQQRFINGQTCAVNMTANITNGSRAATLSATTSMENGQQYSVTAAAGIVPGTWFRYVGSPNVTLSQAATATNATQACVIQPYVAMLAADAEF